MASKSEERAARTAGYADGLAGKPPLSADPVYRVAYRRGVEALERIRTAERRKERTA